MCNSHVVSGSRTGAARGPFRELSYRVLNLPYSTGLYPDQYAVPTAPRARAESVAAGGDRGVEPRVFDKVRFNVQRPSRCLASCVRRL